MKLRIGCVVVGFSLFVLSVAAQTASSGSASSNVPPLIPFSSIATEAGGSSLSGVVNITFSLYAAQQGGAPLWTETQSNIQLDATGHYSVQLGITQPNGVPTTLFTTTEARWLGVQIAEQVEQPRVLLLSVPYALKAGDAATLGGLPPSAFVLAAPPSGSAQAAPPDATATPLSSAPPPTGTNVTGAGTVNYLPLWDTTSDIVSSVVFQSATSPFKIGVGTATPATTLDVKGTGTIRGALSLPAIGTATATKGSNSQPLDLVASAYNTTAAVNETFQLQAEAASNDKTTASGTLNFLFGSGTTKAAETGLHIASNGQITFATGQTFPGTGTGTLTGITTATGSGLTGGGTSGTLNLGLLTTCATNQVLQWNGTAWACATVGGSGGGSGTVTSVATGLGLLGGPITTTGTLTIDTTVVPQLRAATNTFTGSVNANVVNATAGFDIGGSPFAFGAPLGGSNHGNSFFGFAGNSTLTGSANVGVGWAALGGDTIGGDNTAVGVNALSANNSGVENTALGFNALLSNGQGSTSNGNENTAIGFQAAWNNQSGFNNTAIGASSLSGNTTGSGNTAIGMGTLGSNLTGSNNTALGYEAGPTLTTLSNTTAIGYQAAVSVSNALVLGGTGSAAVKVGIGTAAPAYTLDTAGTIRSSTGGFMFPDGTTQTTAASGGGGTITGVTAGTGLTGGGTTGNVTLSINTATIPQLSAANAFTGTITAGTSSGSSFGVLGESNATSGQNYGVGGLATSPAGFGVEGLNLASGGIGVYGFDSAGTGVSGSGLTYGVYGTATGAGAWAVYGTSTGSGNTVGVFGSGAFGVQGSGTTNGVYGTGANGVYGSGTANGVYGTGPNNGVGVYGTGGNGVEGNGTNSGVVGNGTDYGVVGSGPNNTQGTGVLGQGERGVEGDGMSYGVYGGGNDAVLGSGLNGGTGIYGSGGQGDPDGFNAGVIDGDGGAFYGGGGAGGDPGGYGIYAVGGMGPDSNALAGYFAGDVFVSGNLSKSSGSFKIDHPLDPANKYLYHSFVESPDMMNIYNGNVTTDSEGAAVVTLPDWFETLNRDFRYQLTVIGQFAQAIVGSKVANHQFSIKTDKPNVEVSWQITGIRQDAWANAHRIPVEVEKDARERGHYIHPELYGASEEQSIEWARHHAKMRKQQEMGFRQLASAQGRATTTRAETLPLAGPLTPHAVEPRALPASPLPSPPVRPGAGQKPAN